MAESERRCPKCGGPEVSWGPGEGLCLDWHCWPVAPTNPEECESTGKVLASEMKCYGESMRALIRRHDGFIARCVATSRADSTGGDVVALMASVAADVFWMVFQAQFPREADTRKVAHAYSSMWTALADAAAQRTVPPAGTRLN